MGCIYKITNSVNGKAYIGKTVNNAEKGRIRKHLDGKGNQIIKRVVAKYGKDVFSVEILHDGIIPELLDSYEMEAIATHNTVSPNGFNLTSGGEGAIPSDEARRKMSEAHKGNTHRRGKKANKETRTKISKATAGKNNPNYGKNPSIETRRKMSEKQTGKKLSIETRNKMSEVHKGRIFSKEHRQRIGESNKGRVVSHETRNKISESLKGNKVSVETRRKLSEASAGRKLSDEHRRKISEGLNRYQKQKKG